MSLGTTVHRTCQRPEEPAVLGTRRVTVWQTMDALGAKLARDVVG